jgi:uncharacterized membrane protein YccC
VAFKLELQAPYWAATSAAIVCQPSLGASLRKGGFRMIGTLVGATAIVAMVAAFPQSRAGLLVMLALWIGACGFMAAILRNFAGYAAALSGYTAAIIFADSTTDPGQTFTLAVTRAAEICLGIVCAGLVLAGTDFGTARRRLAGEFAAQVRAVASGLAEALSPLAPDYEVMRGERRALVLRAVQLEALMDEAVGEASDLRTHSGALQRGVNGVLAALTGWRNVANHRQALAERGAPPPGALPGVNVPDPSSLLDDPWRVRRDMLAEIRRIARQAAHDIPSRLIADRTAEALLGLCRTLEGLVLLAQPGHKVRDGRGARPRVPDLLPPLIIFVRSVLLMAAMALFWIATGWQGGQLAITFAAVAVTLFSPREDEAYGLAAGFAEGTILTVAVAGIVQFAVLPAVQGFAGLCAVFGVFLIPMAALTTYPWQKPVTVAMMMNFVPILGPANLPAYDPAAFLNTALAIAAGTTAAALAIRLLPPLPPALRIARLHRLTLRDFRRLARCGAGGQGWRRSRWRRSDWEGRVYARILALPPSATVLDSARLLGALSAGDEMLRLRGMQAVLGAGPALAAVETALGRNPPLQGAPEAALADLQDALAQPDADPGREAARLRALASADVLGEILARHGQYLRERA